MRCLYERCFIDQERDVVGCEGLGDEIGAFKIVVTAAGEDLAIGGFKGREGLAEVCDVVLGFDG